MNFHDDSDESSECLDLYDIIEIEQVLVSFLEWTDNFSRKLPMQFGTT